MGAWLPGCFRGRSDGIARLGFGAIPGVTRRSGNVFLAENHNVAHLIWHTLGIRNATLVHVDTHDDYRYVEPAKLIAIQRLLGQRDLDSLFRLSDIGFSMAFQVRPADQLFDLGNFIYPCVGDGTVGAVYWVVPEKELERARVGRLAQHFQHVLQLPALPHVRHLREGVSELALGQRPLTICTLDALPSFPRGALLDLDVDFFAFPHSLAQEHLPGALIWNPAHVCRILRARVPEPTVTTVCSSVWGGYLPVVFRFLADACFDFMVSGQYPAYAEVLLDETVTMRTMRRMGRQPDPPADPHYLAAWTFLGGVIEFCWGQGEEGLTRMEEAAKSLAVYQKGLLDAAEAFLYMAQPDRTDDALARFERLAGGATTGSLTWRARAFLARGDLKGAEELSNRLVQWERQPFSLMLHGGVLTEQGRFDEAAGVYAEVIRMDPSNGEAYYNMGVTQDRQGKVEEAMEYYGKALELRPRFADAHENLGYLLLRRRQLDRAIIHFRETVRVSPLRVKAWGNLGLAHAGKGEHDKAITYLRRALAINPQMPELRLYLAEQLHMAGHADEAARECAEVIRLRPNWDKATDLLRQVTSP